MRVALDIGPDLDERGATRVREVVAHLLQRHDTTTERADVVAIAEAYSNLSDTGRVRFFSLLTRDFWTDADAVERAIKTWQGAADGDAAGRGRARVAYRVDTRESRDYCVRSRSCTTA